LDLNNLAIFIYVTNNALYSFSPPYLVNFEFTSIHMAKFRS